MLRISTELSRDAPLAPLDASFALEGFVRRDALMPVLTTAKAASMADGSGYALAPGLLVARRGGSLALADSLLEDVPVALELSDVGLAFESKALPPLPTLDAAAELGCERQRASGRTVVLPMDELTRRTPPEQSDRPFGIDVSPASEQYPCTLGDDAVASVGSRNWRGASELSPCAWGPALRAYRVGGDVLLDVPLPLTVLRVKSTESKFESWTDARESDGVVGGLGSSRLPRSFAMNVVFRRPAMSGRQHPRGLAAAPRIGPTEFSPALRSPGLRRKMRRPETAARVSADWPIGHDGLL